LHDEFIHRLLSAARDIFEGTDVLAAYAFGSRISGRPLPGSDLDVGYHLRGPRRWEALSLLEEMRLADRLSIATRLEVDFRCLATAPLELQGRVLVEGLRIFSANDEERVSLETSLLARYHDYAAEFRIMHEIRLKAHSQR
jgi:predicted nucleotidyltransferase